MGSQYSVGPIMEHSKSDNIQIQNVFKFNF